MKVVVDHAREQGARVAVSDAETAMMTEGHDQREEESVIKEFQDKSSADAWVAQNPQKRRIVSKYHSDGRIVRYAGKEVAIPEESGMRQHYDPNFSIRDKDGNILAKETFPDADSAKRFAENRTAGLGLRPGTYEVGRGSLHEIMSELTGEKGRPENFGEHKMAVEDKQGEYMDAQGRPVSVPQTTFRKNLLFESSPGVKKTTATGLSYDLAKSRKDFSLFGSDKPETPKTGGLGVAEAQRRGAQQRSETGAINPLGSERRKAADDTIKKLLAKLPPYEEGRPSVIPPLDPSERTETPESEKPPRAPTNEPIAVRYMTNEHLMDVAGVLEVQTIDAERMNDSEAPKLADLGRRVENELYRRGLPSPANPRFGREDRVPEQGKTEEEAPQASGILGHAAREGWTSEFDQKKAEAERQKTADAEKVPGITIPEPKGWESAFDRKKRSQEGAITMQPLKDVWDKMSSLARSLPTQEKVAQSLDAGENAAAIHDVTSIRVLNHKHACVSSLLIPA